MYSLPDPNYGLTLSQAEDRLRHFGPNQLETEEKLGLVHLFINQLRSPLVYILVGAAAITLLMGDFKDATIIFVVVILNTLLGFYQEYRTSKALQALRGYLKPQVLVLRQGRRVEVLLEKLVPGDVVTLDTGDSLPADGLIISSTQMALSESILTGESVAVPKKVPLVKSIRSLAEACVSYDWRLKPEYWGFMGTTVSSGFGALLVLKTGPATRMGQIATNLATITTAPTPLQKQLSRLAGVLVWIILAISFGLFLLGILRGRVFLEMLLTSVAVAVAAIPEGLIIAMTVVLALGMQRILRRKALVRTLVAAETLGSVNVICADKTGTLTHGKLTLTQAVGNISGLVRVASLVGNQRDEESRAMLVWVRSKLSSGVKLDWVRSTNLAEIQNLFPRQLALPFNPKDKFTASLNHGPDKSYVSMAGASEVVLPRCQLSQAEREAIEAEIDKLSRQGMRLIACAGKLAGRTVHSLSHNDLKDLEWYGLLAFTDPLRKQAAQAIKLASQAGVDIKVITGDYQHTALAVLEPALGHLAESAVITGDQLDKLTESELINRLDSLVLFARTTPDQKLTIVRLLKKTGKVVAMTGDGVNDAPALKAADVGIVVAEATDVAKQTADIVLLNSSLLSIIAAIKEGRIIYQSIRKIAAYLLSDSFQEVVIIGGSLLLGLPLPVTAAQILWINLVEDSFLGVSLAFETADDDVMKRPPRQVNTPLLSGYILWLIGVVVVVSNLTLAILLAYLIDQTMPLERLQTIMFAAMATNSLFYIFSIKSLERNIWQINLWNNRPMLSAVVLGFILTLMAIYLPPLQNLLGTVSLDLIWLAIIVALGLVTVAVVELVKFGRCKILGTTGN